MSKQVPWTKTIMQCFIDEAMLSEEEIFILETRVKGWPISKQAAELNRSESSIHKSIAQLKKKYDRVQKLHPDTMPPRRASAKEAYMDTH